MRSDFGYRTTNKSRYGRRNLKNESGLQLPKINRTVFVSQTIQHKVGQSFFQQGNYLATLGDIIKTQDYKNLSFEQIDNEYKQLRKQLVLINQEVVRALKKLQGKPQRLKTMEKSIDKTIQVRQREIQNNAIILEMHRRQLAQLQKRTKFIQSASKQNFQEQIGIAREKIEKVRNRIKELKKKQKLLGNQIVNSDQIFEEMRKLQIELDSYNKKKFKLQKSIDHVQQGITNALNKIQSINQAYLKAEQFFSQQTRSKQGFQALKKKQHQLRYKKEILEVSRKKNHSQLQIKQQKYHSILKQFQNEIQRSKKTVQCISDVEMKIMISKNNLALLQESLKHISNEKEVIRTTSRMRKQENSFLSDLQSPTTEVMNKTSNRNKLKLDFSKFTRSNQSLKKQAIKGNKSSPKKDQKITISINENVQHPSQDDKTIEKTQIQGKHQELDDYLKQGQTIEIKRNQPMQAKIIDFQQSQKYIHDSEKSKSNSKSNIEQQLKSKPKSQQKIDSQLNKIQSQQKIEEYERQFRNEISEIQEKLAEKQKFRIDLGNVTQKINSLESKNKSQFNFDEDFNEDQ